MRPACASSARRTAGSSIRASLPSEQTDESVYKNNPLDRGHLVRRLDPAWGTSREEAKLCNDDTFHFTNCSPQHEDFNQNQTTWAGLEDYILENADNRDFRVTVFTGPVFAADDDQFAGIQLPREFWKVVVMVKESGDMSATAYLLSQAELIAGLEVMPEEFSYGAYRTFQVPVRKVEERTRLSFGTLPDVDPLAGLEADTRGRDQRLRRDQALSAQAVGAGTGAWRRWSTAWTPSTTRPPATATTAPSPTT